MLNLARFASTAHKSNVLIPPRGKSTENSYENRPVVLVAGGYNQATAEVYDYTRSDLWEESMSLLSYSIWLSMSVVLTILKF